MIEDTVPPPSNIGLILTGFIAVLIVAAVFVRWALRQRIAKLETQPGPVVVTATLVADPALPALPSGEDKSKREKRLERIKAHLALPSPRPCLFCSSQAIHTLPGYGLMTIRGVDWLLRVLSVVRLDRWFITLDNDVHQRHALCSIHYEERKGVLAKELAEVSAETVAYMDKIRSRMRAHEQYGADEIMQASSKELRRGNDEEPQRKSRRTRTSLEASIDSNVRQLKAQ